MSAHFRIAFIAVIVASCASCLAPTRCTVTNNSSETLTHVVVSGSTFSTPVPDLGPGSSRIVTLDPHGEEGTLAVAFRAQGRDIRHTESNYFEAAGYEVRIVVGSELQVTTEIGIAQSGLPKSTPSR